MHISQLGEYTSFTNLLSERMETLQCESSVMERDSQ